MNEDAESLPSNPDGAPAEEFFNETRRIQAADAEDEGIEAEEDGEATEE